jgi:hypothetical protein
MPLPRPVVIVVALALLIGVAAPPVLEDHLEAGFCSADCPDQHAGHITAIAPPPAPRAGRHRPTVVIAAGRLADTDRGAVATPDAPRAPPSA